LANTLAYYDTSKIATIKSFITQTSAAKQSGVASAEGQVSKLNFINIFFFFVGDAAAKIS
jgi:hypothetical protein